jgi:hypothetical protein
MLWGQDQLPWSGIRVPGAGRSSVKVDPSVKKNRNRFLHVRDSRGILEPRGAGYACSCFAFGGAGALLVRRKHRKYRKPANCRRFDGTSPSTHGGRESGISSALGAENEDPNAAQFKWMPVIIAKRENITDYCGLVNGKNSYGGYTGYLRFYAFLTADANGQYTRGEARAFEEPNRQINPIDPRWLNGVCEQYGYVDFSQAQP